MGPFGGMLKELPEQETGFKLYGQENTISGDFNRGNRWIERDRFLALLGYAIKPGDIVLTRKGSVGHARLVREGITPGIADSDTIRIRVDPGQLLPEFLTLLLHDAWYLSIQLTVSKHGAILAGLSTRDVEELRLLLPTRSEQFDILQFLDRETAKIDRLKDVRRRQIDVLREQRAAVIHHAVTQGLDPTLPKKDSGIPWLGMVPEHWEVRRLKFVARINPSKGSSRFSPEDDDMVVFLPMECVSETGELVQSNRASIGSLWKGYTYFERGDVVVAKITPCFENGKGANLVALESIVGFGTTEFHVLRPGRRIAVDFLYLLTTTTRFRGIGARFMTGAAGQQRVPETFIANFPVPLPPREEQHAIVAHIDRATAKIDALISKYERELELLDEYRASLISHVVTGKVDVRGLV